MCSTKKTRTLGVVGGRSSTWLIYSGSVGFESISLCCRSARKWLTPRRNFEVGDVALIVDDKAPRNSWLLGRVQEVVSKQKGFVRRVKIKTLTSMLDRPVNKLVLVLESDVN